MKESKDEHGKPPFFDSWNKMYFFVLGNLAFTILVFYLLTHLLK